MGRVRAEPAPDPGSPMVVVAVVERRAVLGAGAANRQAIAYGASQEEPHRAVVTAVVQDALAVQDPLGVPGSLGPARSVPPVGLD